MGTQIIGKFMSICRDVVRFAPHIRPFGLVADDSESRHSLRQRSTGSDPKLC